MVQNKGERTRNPNMRMIFFHSVNDIFRIFSTSAENVQNGFPYVLSTPHPKPRKCEKMILTTSNKHSLSQALFTITLPLAAHITEQTNNKLSCQILMEINVRNGGLRCNPFNQCRIRCNGLL